MKDYSITLPSTPKALKASMAGVLLTSIALPSADTHVDGLVCNNDTYFLWDRVSSNLYSMKRSKLEQPQTALAAQFELFVHIDTRPYVSLTPCSASCAVSNRGLVCVDAHGVLHILDFEEGRIIETEVIHVSYVIMWRETQFLAISSTFAERGLWLWAILLNNPVLLGFPIPPFKFMPQNMMAIPNVGVFLTLEHSKVFFLEAHRLDLAFQLKPSFMRTRGLFWIENESETLIDHILISAKGRYIVIFNRPRDALPTRVIRGIMDSQDHEDPNFLGRPLPVGSVACRSVGVTRDFAFFLEEFADKVDLVIKLQQHNLERWICDTLQQIQLESNVAITDEHWRCCVTLLVLYVLFHCSGTIQSDADAQRLAQHLKTHMSRWNLFYVHQLDYALYVQLIHDKGPILHNHPIIAQMIREAKLAFDAYSTPFSTDSSPSFWTPLSEPIPELQRHVRRHFSDLQSGRSPIIEGVTLIYGCIDTPAPITVVLTKTRVWILTVPNSVVSHDLEANEVCHDAHGIFLLSCNGLLWELDLLHPDRDPLTHITSFELRPWESFHTCSANANISKKMRGVVAATNHNMYYWRPSLRTSTWHVLDYKTGLPAMTTPTSFDTTRNYGDEISDHGTNTLCVWCGDLCYFTPDVCMPKHTPQPLYVLKTKGRDETAHPVTVSRWQGTLEGSSDKVTKEWRNMLIDSMAIRLVDGQHPRLAVLFRDPSEEKGGALACFSMTSANQATWETYTRLGGTHSVQIHWNMHRPYLVAYGHRQSETRTYFTCGRAYSTETRKEIPVEHLGAFRNPSDKVHQASVVCTPTKCWGVWMFPPMFHINEEHRAVKRAKGPLWIKIVTFSSDQTDATDAESSKHGTQAEETKEEEGSTTTGTTEKTPEQIALEVRQGNERARALKGVLRDRRVVPGLHPDGDQNPHERPNIRPHNWPEQRGNGDNAPAPPVQPKQRSKKKKPLQRPAGTVSSLGDLLLEGSLNVPRESPEMSKRMRERMKELVDRRLEEEAQTTHIYPKGTTTLTEAFRGKAITQSRPGLIRAHQGLDEQSDQDQFHNGAYFRMLCSFIHAVYVQYKENHPIVDVARPHPGAASSSSSRGPRVITPEYIDFEMNFQEVFMPERTTQPRTVPDEWITQEWRQNPEMEMIVRLARQIWGHTTLIPTDIIQILNDQIQEEWGFHVDVPQPIRG